jgi:hypothetical protein
MFIAITGGRKIFPIVKVPVHLLFKLFGTERVDQSIIVLFGDYVVADSRVAECVCVHVMKRDEFAQFCYGPTREHDAGYGFSTMDIVIPVWVERPCDGVKPKECADGFNTSTVQVTQQPHGILVGFSRQWVDSMQRQQIFSGIVHFALQVVNLPRIVTYAALGKL